ncbi:MAG: hypothetical protein Q9173_001422 [Seirophora scorigena]
MHCLLRLLYLSLLLSPLLTSLIQAIPPNAGVAASHRAPPKQNPGGNASGQHEEHPNGRKVPNGRKGTKSQTEDNISSSEEKKEPNGFVSQPETINDTPDNQSPGWPDSRPKKDPGQAGDGDDDRTSRTARWATATTTVGRDRDEAVASPAEETPPPQDPMAARPATSSRAAAAMTEVAEPTATSGTFPIPSLPPSTTGAAAAGDVARGAAAAVLLGPKAHHLVGLLLASCLIFGISSTY